MPSLAARCTACDTVFRVVQDQLRVAGGLVRCGRCGEVFNAAETLIDLDTAAPIGLAALPADGAPAEAPKGRAEPMPMPVSEATAEAAMAALDFTAVEPTPASPWASSSGSAAAWAAEPEPQAEPKASATLRAEADDQPSFVRNADRAQRWRQPRRRAALATLGLLSAVALAAQAVYSWRDPIAARVPGTRPALEAACGALACRIEAVRAIDKLAVESSGLVRVEKSNVYKLQVTLRNRSDIPLAIPAFDLSLSDGSGKPLARRVLRAADLGVNTATLAAGRELALQATLQAATEPIAGYTVELFYP